MIGGLTDIARLATGHVQDPGQLRLYADPHANHAHLRSFDMQVEVETLQPRPGQEYTHGTHAES